MGGGSELALYYLTRELSARGHEVHVLLDEGIRRDYVTDGVQVHSYTLPNDPLRAYTATLSMLSKLHEHFRFELFVDFEQVLMWRKSTCTEAVIRYAKSSGTRLVYYFGNHYPWLVPKEEANPRILWFSLRRLVTRAYKVVTASSALARSVIEKTGVAEERISVVPFGLDLREYAPEVSRARSGVLYVGRITRHKGLEDLIEAASILARQGFQETFTVIGPRGTLWDDTPSDYFRSLVTKAQNMGLGDKIMFTGALPRSDLIDHMRRKRVFAFPSHAEGFGVALIQAMASGLVPAVYDFEPVSEVVGDAGFKAKPFEPEGFADAVLRAYESGKGEIASLDRAKRFSISKVGEEFLKSVS